MPVAARIGDPREIGKIIGWDRQQEQRPPEIVSPRSPLSVVSYTGAIQKSEVYIEQDNIPALRAAARTEVPVPDYSFTNPLFNLVPRYGRIPAARAPELLLWIFMDY
jgi:hypothetical protein